MLRIHDPVARFEERITRDEKGCWIWQGKVGTNGRAIFKVNARTTSVHRWAYEHYKGPIPDGLVLDHLCKTPLCVNPDHLESVTVLENNKQAYANAFVQRSQFTSAFPTSLTPASFVDSLFANAAVTPPSSDRAAAIAEFGAATNTTDTAARARALRRVAENATLAQQEFNRAFVLMQYFGYLRRNPNDAPEATLDFRGYNFWLDKLNSFNGNFIAAEMVKAFLSSSEYRRRFGP